MTYDDRRSLTFSRNFRDEPLSQPELNPINTLPWGSSISCWTFFSTIFLGGLVFWIVNSLENKLMVSNSSSELKVSSRSLIDNIKIELTISTLCLEFFQFEKYSWQLTLLVLPTLDFFTQPKLRRSLNQEVDSVTFEHLAKSQAHPIGTARTTPSRPPNTPGSTSAGMVTV